MARVTVEDCILKVPNRFELVLMASQRAREIGSGAPLLVERDNDKNPVVALREIADTSLSMETLHESLVRGHQKIVEVEEDREETIDFMEGETEWAHTASASAAVELNVASQEDVAVVQEDADVTEEVEAADDVEESIDMSGMDIHDEEAV